MTTHLCDSKFPKIFKTGDGSGCRALNLALNLEAVSSCFVPYLQEHLPLDFLNSSASGGQKPSQLLFLTLLPLEHMKTASSVDHANKPRFLNFLVELLVSNFAHSYKTFNEITLFLMDGSTC